MFTMEAITVREAMSFVPKVNILTLVKEGTPAASMTEKQKAYEDARFNIFNLKFELNKDRVRNLLTTKLEEVNEAIQVAPLKGATDRDGFTLGNIRDLTELAIQEFDGKLNAKTVLRRVLEMEADSREVEVNRAANDIAREGLVINRETGGIYLQSFPNQDKKEMAVAESQERKTDFLKAKERLQKFTSQL